MFVIEDDEENALDEARLQQQRRANGPIEETKDGRLLVAPET